MDRIDRTESERRLTKLVAILRDLPEEKFDYTHWIGPDWKGDPKLSCGTTACALGWATADEEFRELGLRAFQSESGAPPVIVFQVGGWTAHNFDAAEFFFGVTSAEASFLFSPGQSGPGMYWWTSPWDEASPGEVAEHIEQFVEVRGKVNA